MARRIQSPGATARDRPPAPPLIEAKLALPRRPSALIERWRIRQTLESGGRSTLTLVAAPAGYGKTSSVSDWCSKTGASLAWVSLDPADNDPIRLWTYVATAVDRVRRGLGQRALQRLKAPGGSLEEVVDALMDGIAVFGGELIVVLDDLHVLTDTECLSSIDYALLHLPPNARLVVVTRVEPALSLDWLRAGGQLTELRARELAFTLAEAHELLVVCGHLPLERDDVEALVEHTEGWPAALVLAGLWLQKVGEPSEAARRFGGSHRFVAAYLSSEVLGALDDDRRSFLHGLSVLGAFTPALCDHVLGRTDSAAQLADLERSLLFVSRSEHGEWFRMHPLFAEYARAELARLEPTAAAAIHRRAADWLRSRGLAFEAAEHATAAGDHELAAQILVEFQLPLIRHGAALTYVRWVRSLPDECIAKYPVLAASAGLAAVLAGGSTIEQRRLLRLAERTLGRQHVRGERGEVLAELFVLMQRTATVDDGVGQAKKDGLLAVGLAEATLDEAVSGALAAYGRALFFAGDFAEAEAVSSRTLEHPEIEHRTPGLVVAHATAALAAVQLGRVVRARKHAEEAKAAVARIASSRSWLGANASAALGAVLAAEGRLAEAEHELATAQHFFASDVPNLHDAWLEALIARVRARRGRLDEADAALAASGEALDALADSGWVPTFADEVKREIAEVWTRASSGELVQPPSAVELHVLELLETAMSTREIANTLYVSPNTVRSHTHTLYRKLGVHSRVDAVARGALLGLVSESRPAKALPGRAAEAPARWGDDERVRVPAGVDD
jgi:LuxR family maltose regulon positive regulatory protein